MTNLTYPLNWDLDKHPGVDPGRDSANHEIKQIFKKYLNPQAKQTFLNMTNLTHSPNRDQDRLTI